MTAALTLYDLADARDMRRKRGPKPRPVAERFWRHVDKLGPNGCWVWTGYRDAKGYGSFNSGSRGELAHRFSYRLANGALSSELPNVLHRCDNPPCVNPAHLFAGTQLDNIRDAVQKGRLHNGQRRRTHCKREHLLPAPDRRGWRQCRECKRDLQIQRRARAS